MSEVLHVSQVATQNTLATTSYACFTCVPAAAHDLHVISRAIPLHICILQKKITKTGAGNGLGTRLGILGGHEAGDTKHQYSTTLLQDDEKYPPNMGST